MEKTKYEINIKFLKNLHSDWRQVTINLQMSQNLGQFGLHDLYNMLVQHEDLISGKRKKSSSLSLITVPRISTSSRGSSSKQVEITDNEPVFAQDSDESDEELKKLTSSMSMFARDIIKLKETKGVDKYHPQWRPEAPYQPTERFQDRYQQQQKSDDCYCPQEKYDDRYRPNGRPDDRYRPPDRRYDDR